MKHSAIELKKLQQVHLFDFKLWLEKIKGNQKLDLTDKVLDITYIYFSMNAFFKDCYTNTDSDLLPKTSHTPVISLNWHTAVVDIAILLSVITVGVLISKPMADRFWLCKKLRHNYADIRRIFSHLKNGRHAVNYGFFLVHQLITKVPLTHLPMLFHPATFTVGVVLCLTSIWHQCMDNKRTEMKKENITLLKSLTNNKSDTLANNSSTQTRITTCDQSPKRQSLWVKGAMYATATLDGLTDGLYLYGCLLLLVTGAASLGILSFGIAPAIILTTLMCVYAASSIISKVHDEYQKQRELDQIADEIDIARLSNIKEKDEKQTTALQTQKNAYLKKYGDTPKRCAKARELNEIKQHWLKNVNDYQTEMKKSKNTINIMKLMVIYQKNAEKLIQLTETVSTTNKAYIAQLALYDESKTNLKRAIESIVKIGNIPDNSVNKFDNLLKQFDNCQQQKVTFHQNAPSHTTNYGALLKGSWYVGRAVLSGAKNMKRIVYSLGMLFHNVILKPIIFVSTSIIGGLIYGIYLGIKKGVEQYQSHQKTPRLPLKSQFFQTKKTINAPGPANGLLPSSNQ